eukprot:Nitzschia sp. Nitz4//scaffold218_size35881//17816//18892//NITZ4_007793-RA/size35881-processed-gene-0.18-mRNA-1//-1//CDS//3329542277//1151//frame0
MSEGGDDETRTVSIQIPEDAEPGDTLSFEINGQSMDIVVPEGSQPGDVLQLQLADPTTDETTEVDETKVDLGDGFFLELCSELPSDHQDAQPETTSEGGAVNDSENDGTYALPWRSGIELATQWESLLLNSEPLKLSPPKRILELGSGLGVVGMSFAIQKTLPLAQNAEIVLTDLPAGMPLLSFNVEKNRALFPSSTTVKTKALRWSLDQEKDDPFRSEPPFNCILGSDLLYNVEHIPALVATIKRMLHPTKGVVILVVRWRKPELERTFFKDSGLEWTLLKTNQLAASSHLTWEAFGNPSVEASNQYFHQTQISVQGNPKSLASLSEDDVGQLDTRECTAWEQAYIQFYIGRYNLQE